MFQSKQVFRLFQCRWVNLFNRFHSIIHMVYLPNSRSRC
jgi:hypothetical protein